MKRFRWLLLAALALTLAGPVNAQVPSFSTVGLPALFGQEAPNAPPKMPPCLEIELSLDCCEGNWLTTLVQDCLHVWQQLWKRGNYHDAEMLAEKAVRLAPTNVEAQHAHVVAQIVNSYGGVCGTMPTPTVRVMGFSSPPGTTSVISTTQACPVGVFADQQLRQAFGLACEAPCVCPVSAPKAVAKGCPCTRVVSSCCCTQTGNACACATQACSCTKPCACCQCGRNTVTTAPVFQVSPPRVPHYVVQPTPPLVAPQPAPVMPPAEAPSAPVVIYRHIVVPHQAVPVNRVVPAAPQRVRLETAHFEAQCAKMTCVGGGDVVLLEGNVEMHVRRQTGPFRVQAQRVRVYLHDGTFVVEGAQDFVAPPPPAATAPVRPARRIVIPPTVPPTDVQEAYPSSGRRIVVPSVVPPARADDVEPSYRP